MLYETSWDRLPDALGQTRYFDDTLHCAPAPQHRVVTSWRDWDGATVANFISAYCDLPQYASTAEQNLTGAYLYQLISDGMLCKGLTRAGIVDCGHQRTIKAGITWLRRNPPEDVMREWGPKVAVSQQEATLQWLKRPLKPRQWAPSETRELENPTLRAMHAELLGPAKDSVPQQVINAPALSSLSSLPPLRSLHPQKPVPYFLDIASPLGVLIPIPTPTAKILNKTSSTGALMLGRTFPMALPMRQSPLPWGCTRDPQMRSTEPLRPVSSYLK